MPDNRFLNCRADALNPIMLTILVSQGSGLDFARTILNCGSHVLRDVTLKSSRNSKQILSQAPGVKRSISIVVEPFDDTPEVRMLPVVHN